jgi:type IV pilus assembly protein PilB
MMVQFDVKRVQSGNESFMVSFDFNKTPVTQIADYIIIAASKHGTSDIHFDPRDEGMMVRFRIDGDCQDYTFVPKAYEKNLTTRLKLLANMNITESRLPQDGAIKGDFGGQYLDMRVSALPLNTGEKIVIRILDYTRSLQGIDSLGFHPKNLEKIKRMMGLPNGIILTTGATGSGKSTTVYSILSRLNTREVNIITVEDPVEMDVNGINQVQAQQEIGLDFAAVLRSILRQDPDIIMIGEIRDGETAKIAVRASITGHKVLSTIHTNSALNTIERLTDMEVERYLIGTSLNGCISQKLAKKLCPHCRKERVPSDYEQSLFEKVLHTRIEKIYDTNEDGCENCMKGFKGRICLAEVLLIGDEVRTAITNNASKEEMRRLVYGKGSTHTLLEDGLEKVALGETSFDEVLKLVDLENDLAIHNDLNQQGIEFKPFDIESAMPKKPVAPNPAPVAQPQSPTPAPTPAPVQNVAPVQSVQPVQPVVVQAPAPVQPIAPQVATPVQTQQQIQQQLSDGTIDVTSLIPHN